MTYEIIRKSDGKIMNSKLIKNHSEAEKLKSKLQSGYPKETFTIKPKE